MDILLFAGFTISDTQKLKEMHLYGNYDAEAAAKVSVYGTLQLYLDFINIFQFRLLIASDGGQPSKKLNATSGRRERPYSRALASNAFRPVSSRADRDSSRSVVDMGKVRKDRNTLDSAGNSKGMQPRQRRLQGLLRLPHRLHTKRPVRANPSQTCR